MKRFFLAAATAACAFTAGLPAQTAPAAAQAQAQSKPELMLMLPQPKFMAGPLSMTPEGATQTVFTPAVEISGEPGIVPYREEDFKKLGLSVASFAERAGKAADRRLATLKPDFIKDDQGQVQYAVYRSEKPLIASLVMAPSLPVIFEPLFGPVIWVAMPDRHSLFVFPAQPESVEAFAEDLALRYRAETRAASPEIFALKKGSPPRVVASFDE